MTVTAQWFVICDWSQKAAFLTTISDRLIIIHKCGNVVVIKFTSLFVFVVFKA